MGLPGSPCCVSSSADMSPHVALPPNTVHDAWLLPGDAGYTTGPLISVSDGTTRHVAISLDSNDGSGGGVFSLEVAAEGAGTVVSEGLPAPVVATC